MCAQTDHDSALVPVTELPQVTSEPGQGYTAVGDPSGSLKPNSPGLLWLSPVLLN